MAGPDLADLVGRLRSVGDDLADTAVTLLREALRTDDDDERRRALTAEEKRVTRARRAVEKAIRELDHAAED